MTCPHCTRALTNPDHGGQSAQCVGCAIRALATGPLYHAAGVQGSIAGPYRKQLGAIFGDDWRQGHERVKAEHARIKAIRNTACSHST